MWRSGRVGGAVRGKYAHFVMILFLHLRGGVCMKWRWRSITFLYCCPWLFGFLCRVRASVFFPRLVVEHSLLLPTRPPLHSNVSLSTGRWWVPDGSTSTTMVWLWHRISIIRFLFLRGALLSAFSLFLASFVSYAKVIVLFQPVQPFLFRSGDCEILLL